MKVKICGVCRPQDAAAAATHGADYIGVILAPGRRRTQSPQAAARILAQAAGLKRVGVFVDPSVDDVVQLAAQLELDVIQLHGDEPPDVIARIRARSDREVWKTVWLTGQADLQIAIQRFRDCVHGILLDAKHDGESGGTGTRFDWQLASEARSHLPPDLKLIVAGGLTPENVRHAAAMLRPDVVDVATGVETAVGEKSQAAIAAFVRNARI